jgi:ribonuclease HI
LLGDLHPDRYIIYVDGSSQGQQQHHPIAWIEEHGLPDAWAMIVLAERYATPAQTHQLYLVGWTAQQVRYDPANRFHLGSTTPGSLTAEREGMTWAFLWRIGQNNVVPTLIRSDSQLTCDQASGFKGATHLDDSFLCLRGAHQLLDTALPRGHLKLEHIYGHCGEPFNDFTDLMAKQEAFSSFYLPRLKIDMTSWRTKLPHLWLLFAQHLGGPQFHDGYFHTPVPSLPNSSTSSSNLSPASVHGMTHVKIQLSFCTANVLSMYNRPEGYAGKVGYLAEQFQAHCLLFGGIQEARTPEGSCKCQYILRLCSGVSQGQGGVELWINLHQPYGYDGRTPLVLKKENVQVIQADPQRMLARVVTEYLDIFIFVGHAPHSGHPQDVRSTWWTRTTELIHEHCGENKLYVMIDANAEPGPADGRSVLNSNCTTSKSTPLWRQFLNEHQLALPQTLSLHVGGLATWTSLDGSTTHCLDYVAVPVERLSCCTSSQLLESLDLGNEQQDHTPVAVELEWDFHTLCPKPDVRKVSDNFDRTIIRRTKMDGFLENFPTIDWSVDVDTQIQTFNQAVHGELHRLCPAKRKGPKKSFISDEIWMLRINKLRCRKALKHARKLMTRELLATFFQAWHSYKDDHHHFSFAPQQQYMTTLLCGTLRCFVEFRKFAKMLKNDLKTARHQGVADHVDKLPPTASASTILHTLRPLVGTSNLKNKGMAPLPQVLDRDGKPCASPAAALDRWIEFFGNMEGGVRVQAQQQRENWIQNLKNLNSEQVEVDLEALPSLTALESAFRQVSTGKATGPDNIPAEVCNTCPTAMARHTYPLLLKTLLHGHEPLLHKGGRLVPIWKRKLSKQRCEAYRSILISSHVGKCIHRTLRLHQATVYEKYLVRQQIGGQRKAPVTLGVHLTRAYFRHHHLQQRPVALIFLDLSEAFYRVIRPLAVGGCADDETLALIASRLGLPEAILEDLRQHLTADHATKEAQLPQHLQRAQHALHLDTHWHIGMQQDACCTTMGTRPGDAFADVIFGYLWSRVLQNFQQEADADGTTFDAFPADQGPQIFGCPVETEEVPHKFIGPCWMDDLCVAMSADHCETLLRKTRCSASLLIDKCLSHAMQPNLAAGTTEILLAFRGKGARKARIAHYGPLATRQLQVVGEYDTYPLRLVGQYQHLGCIIHHCGDLRKEISMRIAMAHKTFSMHRKVLFHNGAIALPKRVELFESLVLSKFLYGTESWVVPDIKTKEHLHSALIRLFRRLLPLPADCHLTDDQILHQTGLPSPSELLRIQRLRYFGTLMACSHLVDWGVLNQDHLWLALIEDDFRWMHFQLDGATHLGDPQQHFAAWVAIAKDHRSYWRRLVRRAGLHARKQRAREQTLIQFHTGILQRLRHWGFTSTTSTPAPLETTMPRRWGCMACGMSFRSKGGEGAHMCKIHGQVNPVRTLFQGTQCQCCLKEYHTATKLKAHLLRAATCRQYLLGRQTRMHPIPGTGSTQEQELVNAHDRLLPPLQAAGPRQEPNLLRDFETVHWPLHDACCLAFVEIEDIIDLELNLRDIIQAHPISWTMCTATLHRVRATIQEHNQEDSIMQRGETVLLQLVDRLLQTDTWPFLHSSQAIPDGRDLGSIENDILDLCSPADWPIPRQFGRYRIVLHAFSGRRRLGDFQFYLDALLAKQPGGITVLTVSLDIIVDKVKGNIADKEVRAFWFHSIEQGWTIAFLAGPPCETWSKARAVQTATSKGTQPRILRDLGDLWGFPQLRLRELDQVCIGNLLLCFAAEAFLRLADTGGVAAIEHPKEPDEPELASIWRLPLFAALRSLPGVELLSLSQGLLGAKSMKPTQLLCLNLPGMAKAIVANQVTKINPKTSSIGRHSDGNWATGGLKEYPPAFSKALADQFCSAICQVPVSAQGDPDQDFLTVCKAMTVTEFTVEYGRDFAG